MFNTTVNGACKHFVENTGMHESASRLYTAVLELTNPKLSDLGQVASFVGVTPQVLKNWEFRGVSKQGRLDLHRKLGINPDWLVSGKGEMLLRSSPLGVAVTATPNAQGAVTLAQALEVVAASLNELPDARRELAAQHLQTLARAPDSAKAMQSTIEAISANTTGQVAKVLSMTLTKESANLFNQEVQQDADSKL